MLHSTNVMVIDKEMKKSKMKSKQNRTSVDQSKADKFISSQNLQGTADRTSMQ